MMIQSSMFDNINFFSPLADRMRPRNLDEYIGQQHILGKGRPLRKAIENDNIGSMIFWGPPGVGKTTLAMLIATMTHADFQSFSAVTSGVKEIKEVVEKAKQNKWDNMKTIVFVDEIHRFNKSQQDAFLPHVENGNIILIGATTENPSFEINSALLSRAMVYMLKALNDEDIIKLLKNALSDQRGLGDKKIEITEEILSYIAGCANGDARSALNILETLVKSADEENDVIKINEEVVKQNMHKDFALYSKKGDEHYNIISALHKSMRNSDCDAAVYWLARMLEAGENPLYVARRLIRFASEDIGMADPRAMQQAVAAYEAAHYIGMPECSVNLAQAVIYLSVAPKSNSLYTAYEQAKEAAKQTSSEPVPINLINASNKFMKQMGFGKGYEYAHDYEDKITNMQCLPDKLKNSKFYVPGNQGVEKRIKERLDYINSVKDKK